MPPGNWQQGEPNPETVVGRRRQSRWGWVTLVGPSFPPLGDAAPPPPSFPPPLTTPLFSSSFPPSPLTLPSAASPRHRRWQAPPHRPACKATHHSRCLQRVAPACGGVPTPKGPVCRPLPMPRPPPALGGGTSPPVVCSPPGGVPKRWGGGAWQRLGSGPTGRLSGVRAHRCASAVSWQRDGGDRRGDATGGEPPRRRAGLAGRGGCRRRRCPPVGCRPWARLPSLGDCQRRA